MTAQPWTPPGPEWVPGMPLHRRGAHQGGVFSYRDDEAVGMWADAADWPQQTRAHLPDGDEIGDLIAAVRAEGL